MILIEPAIQARFGRALKKRELAGFLGLAAEAIGLAGTVSVLLMGDEQIQELNRDFRRKNKATDVLSFPAMEAVAVGPKRVVGDLAISVETAARQAEEMGHAVDIELKVLTLHGLLHLAGFDHEADSGEMARKERLLRKKLGLSAGLIERSSEGLAKKKSAQKRATRTKAQPAGKNGRR
jgi:probable rRNA maturation factor